METQNQYPQKDYSEIISLSHQVIGLPVRKAQMLLKDLDLCMITYTWNDVSQITLEVVFKTSTLTCLFNQNDICEAVYLFLTDNKDLMKYISHCVKTYTYDFLLDGWTTDKCHISIMPFRKSRVFFINITAKKDFMNKAYCSCFATPLFQTNFLCVPMTMVFSHQKERRGKSSLQRLPFI